MAAEAVEMIGTAAAVQCIAARGAEARPRRCGDHIEADAGRVRGAVLIGERVGEGIRTHEACRRPVDEIAIDVDRDDAAANRNDRLVLDGERIAVRVTVGAIAVISEEIPVICWPAAPVKLSAFASGLSFPASVSVTVKVTRAVSML